MYSDVVYNVLCFCIYEIKDVFKIKCFLEESY